MNVPLECVPRKNRWAEQRKRKRGKDTQVKVVKSNFFLSPSDFIILLVSIFTMRFYLHYTLLHNRCIYTITTTYEYIHVVKDL